MNKKVQFTEDYSTFKKDEFWTASRDLTNMVVGKGVANFVEDKPNKVKSVKKVIKPKSKK